MHLRDRCCGERLAIELREDFFRRRSELALDGFHDGRMRHRRHFVEELCELATNLLGEDVEAHRQKLSELHVRHAEAFEGLAHARADRRRHDFLAAQS